MTQLEPGSVEPDRARPTGPDGRPGRLTVQAQGRGETDLTGWDAHQPALARALMTGDHETALSIYRDHPPVGRCSMDERPAQVARDA